MTVSDGVSPSPKGGPELARPPLNPPLMDVMDMCSKQEISLNWRCDVNVDDSSDAFIHRCTWPVEPRLHWPILRDSRPELRGMVSVAGRGQCGWWTRRNWTKTVHRTRAHMSIAACAVSVAETEFPGLRGLVTVGIEYSICDPICDVIN